MKTRLARKTVYKNRYLTLYEDETVNSKNEIGQFIVVERSSCASVVCITETLRTVILRQHRYPTSSIEIEFPCGGIDPSELPEQAARRELLEEAGITAAALVPLCVFNSVAGLMDHQCHVFITRIADDQLKDLKTDSYDDEILEVKAVKLPEMEKLIAAGNVRDSFTLIGFFMAKKFLEDHPGFALAA